MDASFGFGALVERNYSAILRVIWLRRGHDHAYDHSHHHFDLGAGRRAADLGLQPRLGLWARRRPRIDSHHHHRVGADRPYLASRNPGPLSATRLGRPLEDARAAAMIDLGRADNE